MFVEIFTQSYPIITNKIVDFLLCEESQGEE